MIRLRLHHIFFCRFFCLLYFFYVQVLFCLCSLWQCRMFGSDRSLLYGVNILSWSLLYGVNILSWSLLNGMDVLY
jgi:hypothetical protein